MEYGRAMERREAPEDVRAKGQVRKLMRSRGMNRWGMGGARVEEVHVGDVAEGGEAIDVRIVFDVSDVERAIFLVGFVDENGTEVGAASSPALSVNGSTGEIVCTIRPLPLRSGIYFPVVAIVSEDGMVRDRWQLDRAVVIDRNGDGSQLEGFGPIDISADWSSDKHGASNGG
jgi:hypothetical protein